MRCRFSERRGGEACAGAVERGGRDVESGEVAVAVGEEIVDEGGLSGSDVDD